MPSRKPGGASIDALVAQVSAPVRWQDVVRRLASAGVRAYVEVGPGTVLSGLMRKIQRDARVANLESPEDLEAVEALVATGLAGMSPAAFGHAAVPPDSIRDRSLPTRRPRHRGVPRHRPRDCDPSGHAGGWWWRRLVERTRRRRSRPSTAGGRAELIALEVTDAAAIEGVMAGLLERHGRIDILVNNAGITRDGLLLRMKRDDWDAVIGTNLTAFALTQAMLKPMLRQRYGRIIAVGSVVGQMGNAGRANYAASRRG